MKISAIEKIEKEIDDKIKLPYDIKEKIIKEVFTNIIIASAIILYFIFIELGSVGTIKNVRSVDINIFSVIFLGMSITLFEIGYRKDKFSFAMYGIEFLCVAIFTLFLPYIIFELDSIHRKHYLLSSLYIASYYILKSIYISTRTRIKYMDNISDVKEIVKKEKSKRQSEADKEDIELDETEFERKEKIEISDDKGKELNKAKKRGRPKKTEVKSSESNISEPIEHKKKGRPKKKMTENENIEKENDIPKAKKRGRPKKTEIKSSENTISEKAAPKKRGRPRKVVANND